MSHYVELQVLTHFSLLRGASSPEELFAAAALLGYPISVCLRSCRFRELLAVGLFDRIASFFNEWGHPLKQPERTIRPSPTWRRGCR